MGAEAMMIGSTLGAAGQVFAGSQAMKAGNEEAFETMRATKKEAARKRQELEKFKGKQSMSFLQSGVLLEGSPLLVLEETEQQGSEEIQEITEGGFRKAESLRRAGRDAFIGSLFSAAGGMAKGASGMSGGSMSTGKSKPTATGGNNVAMNYQGGSRGIA